MDNTYGDSPEFAQEFKSCMVCGETNCDVHKEHPLNGGIPVDQAKVMGLRPSDWLEIAGGEIGVKPTDEQKEKADKGEQIHIHSGKESNITIKDDDEEETEEKEEKEEEDFPTNLAFHGGDITARKYKDVDINAKKDPVYTHVLFLREEDVMSSLSGNVRHVTHYRAKKDDEGRMPGRLDAIREKALKHVPTLKRRLHLALEAQARVARERGLKRGQLDAGRLSHVVSDQSGDVFSKKAHSRDIKTAVSIVMDDSGSMAEIIGGAMITGSLATMTPDQFFQSKAGCTAVFAYAIGEVLNGLGITFEIVSYEDRLMDPFHHNGKGPGRFSIEYKGFEEPWISARGRLVNYLPGSGGSLTYESCVFAANRLAKRTEDRKILFQLSDAQSSNHGVDQLYDLSTDLARKAHIQYVGVGILEQSMKTFLKERCEIIDRLDNLNDAIIQKLAKIIHPTS